MLLIEFVTRAVLLSAANETGVLISAALTPAVCIPMRACAFAAGGKEPETLNVVIMSVSLNSCEIDSSLTSFVFSAQQAEPQQTSRRHRTGIRRLCISRTG